MEEKTAKTRKEKKKVNEVTDSSEECCLEKTLTNIEKKTVRYFNLSLEILRHT